MHIVVHSVLTDLSSVLVGSLFKLVVLGSLKGFVFFGMILLIKFLLKFHALNTVLVLVLYSFDYLKLHCFISKPFGFEDCQAHPSLHMSKSERFVFQCNILSASFEHASSLTTSPDRRLTTS